MNFKEMFDMICEKKDHLIAKIPSLSPLQRDTIIEFFRTHANLENKIDWNKLNDLTYKDFEQIMSPKVDIKLGSVKLNVDYIEIDSLHPIDRAFVPITHKGVQYLASNLVNRQEGKWCISLRSDDSHWNRYHKDGYFFVIYVTPDMKYALQVFQDTFKMDTVWDRFDTPYLRSTFEQETGINSNKIIDKSKNKIQKIFPLLPNIFQENDFGDIIVSNRRLTSLKGCPEKVKGAFFCGDNLLTTLIDGPKEVGRDYVCRYNNLVNLIGAPSRINGTFDAAENSTLISIKGCPKYVKRDLNLSFNKSLKTLDCAIDFIGGDLLLANCNLIVLNSKIEKVMGNVSFNSNKLTSLKGSPEFVGVSFSASKNNLETLEGCPKEVKGDFYIRDNYKVFTEEEVRAVCKVGGKVYV